MDLAELLERLTRTLEELGIPYLVTGSVATIAYGEPRFTNDVDVVVRLPLDAIDNVLAAFPEEEFYVSREAVREAVLRATQFNILHPRSGLKVDVIVAGDSEFNSSRFDRSRQLAISPSRTATFASPEDVMATVGEDRAFEDLLDLTVTHEVHGLQIHVFQLAAVIETKQESNRPKDRAALPLLIRTLEQRDRR